jgi:hypothetical protein
MDYPIINHALGLVCSILGVILLTISMIVAIRECFNLRKTTNYNKQIRCISCALIFVFLALIIAIILFALGYVFI